MTSQNYELTYDAEYLSKVDYDMWLGPAPKRPFNRNRFHYNWHWHWDFGNGDTGNQGPHQFDIARWGLNKQEHPVRVSRWAAISDRSPRRKRRTSQTALYEYARRHDPRVRHARRVHERRRTARVGNLFYGTKGWLWIDGTARAGSRTSAQSVKRTRRVPGSDRQARAAAIA